LTPLSRRRKKRSAAVAKALQGAGFHQRGLTRRPDSERAEAALDAKTAMMISFISISFVSVDFRAAVAKV
jgi:hypothetical protein